MAKRRFVVDFSVHLCKSYVVEAESDDEAEELVNRLWYDDDAMGRIQSDMTALCEHIGTFTEGLEADVALEVGKDEWADTARINDFLSKE